MPIYDAVHRQYFSTPILIEHPALSPYIYIYIYQPAFFSEGGPTKHQNSTTFCPTPGFHTPFNMCYIPYNVYTVCAHTRIGKVVQCARQKDRNARLENGNWCANFWLTLRTCRPVELAKLKYWFCSRCREHYKTYDINGEKAILNYWAYKAMSGFAYSVDPGAVPGDLVFSWPLPTLDGPSKVRCELIALDKAWPHTTFETKVQWLRRLERARTVTLELAKIWSSRPGSVQSSEEIDVQPALALPMSAYPFPYTRDHVLSPITEATDSVGFAANLPPWKETVTRGTKQVHLKTLAKLCGEVKGPPGRLPPWLGGAESASPSDVSLVDVPLNPTKPWSSSVSQEMADEKSDQASVPFAQPPRRQLAEQFSHPQRTGQPDFTQPNFTATDPSRPEPLRDGSGEASDSIRDGNVPKTRFNYWDHEVWEDDPDNTAPVEPTRESLKKELERVHINERLVYDSTDSLSVEPVQNSPHRDITATLQTDAILNHEAFTDVALEESNAKSLTKEQEQEPEQDKPNMTSHFSVSEFDPDEATERSSIVSVSSASEDEVFDFEDPDTTTPVPKTKEEVQEPGSPEQRESGESGGSRSIIIQFPAPEVVIVAPEPNRHLSPPRFVCEDCESPNSDAFWDEFGKRSPRNTGLLPDMKGIVTQRWSATDVAAM